jgi:hypothetical protein
VDLVAVRIQSAFDSYLFSLIGLRLLLVVKLVDVITQYLQYVTAAVLHDRAGEGLSCRRLWLPLGAGKLSRLLIRPLSGLLYRPIKWRRGLRHRLWFLQLRLRNQLSPGNFGEERWARLAL